MKIDIEPIIEKANEVDKACIELREIACYYLVRLANGKEYSVKWDDKGLAEFQPNRTVSTMLKEWEEGIKRNHAVAVKALKTGLHPIWTTEKRDEFKRLTGKFEPTPLDQYTRAHFEREKTDREAEFGPLTFSKIIP